MPALDATTARLLGAPIASRLDAHPYRPPLWLPRGAHTTTILNHLTRREEAVEANKESLQTPDGEFIPLHHEGLKPGGDAVLIVHGLEGSSASTYVRATFAGARAMGLGAAAFSFPGCEDPLGTARRLYHSGDTDDLAFVVDAIARRWPGIRLWIVGFSMGGNITGLWLGRTGAEVPEAVHGAVLISAPFELEASAGLVDRTLRGVYVRRFLRTLRQKAIVKHAQHPDAFDLEAAIRARTFAAFDNAVTAPLNGFRDARDYWTRSSCGPALEHARVPILIISAVDDPFHPPETIPRQIAARSPWITAQFPARGGHVAFPTRADRSLSRSWAEAQALRFIDAWRNAWPQTLIAQAAGAS